MSLFANCASVYDLIVPFCSMWLREREKSHKVEMWLNVVRSQWHGQCADFEKAGRYGQLQFAQAQRSWCGGHERGDWTQQLDLTNTERGQCRPTSDAARSCFGDWEKMLSDSERASSIMAPVRLSAGWLWEKRESEKRERERVLRVHQEGNCKRNWRRERTKEWEREEDKGSIVSLPIHWLTAWLLATGPLNRYIPLLHPSTLQPYLSSLSHEEPIRFSSLLLHPSILWPSEAWSLSLDPMIPRPSIPPSWTAECEADRPWSEWGSCQRPAAEPSLTGH